MQMKYTFVSSTLQYHFCRFANPASIALVMSLNWLCLAIFSQLSCMNSRTGIACHPVGFLELENVCWALAGSCLQPIFLKMCEIKIYAHTRRTSWITSSHSQSFLLIRKSEYDFLFKLGSSSLSSVSCTKQVTACQRTVLGMLKVCQETHTGLRVMRQSIKLYRDAHHI